MKRKRVIDPLFDARRHTIRGHALLEAIEAEGREPTDEEVDAIEHEIAEAATFVRRAQRRDRHHVKRKGTR